MNWGGGGGQVFLEGSRFALEMVRLIFGKGFSSEKAVQKEYGYKVDELNFLANTTCMLPNKVVAVVRMHSFQIADCYLRK